MLLYLVNFVLTDDDEILRSSLKVLCTVKIHQWDNAKLNILQQAMVSNCIIYPGGL